MPPRHWLRESFAGAGFTSDLSAVILGDNRALEHHETTWPRLTCPDRTRPRRGTKLVDPREGVPPMLRRVLGREGRRAVAAERLVAERVEASLAVVVEDA